MAARLGHRRRPADSELGAIDQLDAHAATILAKHYGSREAMIEAERNATRYAK